MAKKGEKFLTKNRVKKLGLDKVSVITADMIDGYTSIGDYAFSCCDSLTSIEIPNSVTSIVFRAFCSCTNLTYVMIPNSVTSIGDNTFEWCAGLASIVIPDSVTSIGDNAFFGCIGLTSVTIPNTVTSIGVWAFADCTNLTSVRIGNSVISIGDHAFNNCGSLASIIVENGNSFYDSRNNCNAIIEMATNTLIVGCKNTIIPNSITGIGDRAFWGCSGLTSVTIPNSVTSIGESAFWGCSGLTSIKLPNGLTNIGRSAFENCCSLTSVTFGDKIYKNLVIKDGKCRAYKAFNANMTCRDFKYEEGKTYELDGKPVLCKRGFHACLKFTDVFNYYSGMIGKDIVVHEVKLEGVSDCCVWNVWNNCSKVVAKKITIGEKIL